MSDKIFKTTKELTPFIEEMTKMGKSVNITITGNSMFPLFCDKRDSALIKKSDKYKKGDIILYVRTTKDLVLHRIVSFKKGVFYLCGDNQTTKEYPIYENQIIGKVVSFNRKGKEVKTTNIFYRMYVFFWCLNLKLRKPLLIFALKVKGMFK